MERKYEFTDEMAAIEWRVVHRIKAVRDFGFVKAGELGGFIQSESNLSHEGNAWVYDNAVVCDKSRVSGNSRVDHNACVYGEAQIRDHSYVGGNANVYGTATVAGFAYIDGHVKIHENAYVGGTAPLSDFAHISRDAWISSSRDYAIIKGLGHINRTTTFYRSTDNGIWVNCGCFHGDIKSFREKVKETHRDTKYAKEYLMLADLMELHFDLKQ